MKPYATLGTILALCTLIAILRPAAGQVGSSCTDLACSGAHQQCSEGHCKCKPGYIACGTTCVDITSDAAHCGSCSNACSAPLGCHMGVCSIALPPPPPKPVVAFPEAV